MNTEFRNIVEIKDLLYLAEEFGLPSLLRGEDIIIVGEESILVFNIVEVTKCQLQ